MLVGCSWQDAAPSTERLDAPLRTADARQDAEVRACGPTVNEDIPVERAPQEQAEREAI
jgi:hypothetical protein